MLCLPEKIRREKLSVSGFIRDDEDFTRTRDEIYRNSADELPFSLYDEVIPRAKDFLYRLKGLRS